MILTDNPKTCSKIDFAPQTDDPKLHISEMATIGHMCDYPHINPYIYGYHQTKLEVSETCGTYFIFNSKKYLIKK